MKPIKTVVNLSTISCFSLICLMYVGMANAQTSKAWYVWKNCNTSPCTIGVAQHGYAVPGSVNYIAGWRKASQSYRTDTPAWRTACWFHWGSPRSFNSPDIANGVISCEARCNGNRRCR